MMFTYETVRDLVALSLFILFVALIAEYAGALQ